MSRRKGEPKLGRSYPYMSVLVYEYIVKTILRLAAADLRLAAGDLRLTAGAPPRARRPPAASQPASPPTARPTIPTDERQFRLLAPERDHRIYPRRRGRRDIAGQQGHRGQAKAGRQQSQRVRR